MLKRRVLQTCAVVMVFCGACCAAPQETNAKVKAEIERLRKIASAEAESDDWKYLKPMVEQFLALAETADRSGHTYFAVEEIGKANVFVAANRFAREHLELNKQGVAGFESDWKKSSVQLAALDREAKERRWAGVPAALRALSESAQGQGPTLVEASRAYATVTSPDAGYFYLGEAQANEEFAAFVYGLAVKSKSASYMPRSILPEIQKLQERVNAAFVPPRSIERHKEFIRLNSILKLAGELDTAQLYAGAMYEYLQAVIQFELLDAKKVDEAKQAEVRDEIAKAGERVSGSDQDDSIAQMFVERAETLIADRDGNKALADDWKNAAAAVEYAIPAYFEALRSRDTLPQQQKDAVTVTLVRWPYT